MQVAEDFGGIGGQPGMVVEVDPLRLVAGAGGGLLQQAFGVGQRSGGGARVARAGVRAGLDQPCEGQHPRGGVGLGALEGALRHVDGLAGKAAHQGLHGHGGQHVAAQRDVPGDAGEAGPRLSFDRFDDISDRCDIAPVRPTRREPGYDDGAVVPNGGWKPLTAADAEPHHASDSTPDSVRIELVHRPLPNIDPDDLTGRLEVAARLDPLDGRWPTTLLGCTISPGDRATTTEDSATDRRIGLHVDNFDRLTCPRRHQGRRRLCLNLGPGPRYLLIGDHDVQQICRTLHPDADLARYYPHTQDVRAYVAAGHPLRCLRIRLEPGEGYIAPTELLPHDGSTAGIGQPSVAAFWLGRLPKAP
ncbi:hypothetical protein [Streptomyces sp. PT12]|uniref:hypothetical protein n=1 Tax=Streptomyces sp. PT12 TaxID=1510197 RepID=UPI00215C4104|nr:hypothetical protein [Streptomyces sp. PT12]